MRIERNVHLAALLTVLTFGVVDAQTSTFDQLALLYSYDKSSPLELEKKDVNDRNGIKIYWVSFTVTNGNRANGILVVPQGGNKRRPSIIWMHSGGPFFWFSDAMLMAQAGAISLIISPNFGSPDLPAEQYRDAMIGAVVCIRRAVDILESRPDVDSGKIGYVGHSFGALMGAVAAAVDKRFKAAVFEVGLPGMSYHLRNSPIGWAANHRRMLGSQLESYLKVISPVDAIHYVGRLFPTTLLFQSARLDPGVPEKDALEFYNAASEPKQLKWYDATHEVTDIEAISDRARFLAKQLKLSSIDRVLRKKIGITVPK